MPTWLPPKCLECAHLLVDKSNSLRCKAFPDGIPDVILKGILHNEIWKSSGIELPPTVPREFIFRDGLYDQKGNYVFEPKEK